MILDLSPNTNVLPLEVVPRILSLICLCRDKLKPQIILQIHHQEKLSKLLVPRLPLNLTSELDLKVLLKNSDPIVVWLAIPVESLQVGFAKIAQFHTLNRGL